MKSKSLPVFCGVALVAMCAAATSHWWSVRQIVTAFENGLPSVVISGETKPATTPATPSPAADPSKELATSSRPAPQAAGQEAGREEFYEALVARMEHLQNQNRDLLDQLGETNRDLMKLEFRVDTHSESFRPLPVSEDRLDDTTIDDGPGVLPPRAEPVLLPSYE